nr:hypothetical protein [Bacteroidota bacterium]
MRHFKISFFVSCLFFIGQTVFAQLDEFKLSDYKLPNLKRHQLDLILNSGSDINNETNSIEGHKSDYSGINGNFFANYNYYQNSIKYQGQQNISLDSRYSMLNQQTESDNLPPYKYTTDLSQIQTTININVQSDNRFYYRNLKYFEIQLSTWFILENRKQNTEQNYSLDNYYNSEIRLESNYFFVKLPLYIGSGRIEQVQDARQSIFILNKLLKVNRLQRIPSHDEIIAMSEKISEVKNKRFFDSRLQKIEELDTVNSVLTTMGLIRDTDITYFTSLNDMWAYGDRQQRLAGYRVYFGVEPEMNIATNGQKQDIGESSSTYPQTDEDETSRFTAKRLLIAMGFDYEKPIHQKWQYSFQSKLGVGPATYQVKKDYKMPDYVQSTEKINNMDYSLWLNTEMGFSPNTRTYLTISVGAFVNYNKGTYYWQSENQESKNKSYNLNAGLDAYYYISPKLRLSGKLTYIMDYLDGTHSIDYYNSNNLYSYPMNGWDLLIGKNKLQHSSLFFKVAFSYSIF